MDCPKCKAPMDLQFRRPAEVYHCAHCFLADRDERVKQLAAEEHVRDGWDECRKRGVNVISESEYREGERL